MIERYRRCGCDCRDANRWEPDPAVYNPLFSTRGCVNGNEKPPCKYIARFECDLRRDDNDGTRTSGEWLSQVNMPLRQLCEFGPLGEYVGLIGDPFTGAVTDFHTIENNATFQYACSISQRYNLQGNYPANNTAAFSFLRSLIRWKLLLENHPVTFTRITGEQYAVDQWDCFGPNTLQLVRNPTNQTRLPKWLCITPEIVTAVPQKQCCPTFFQVTRSQIYETLQSTLRNVGIHSPK